MRELLELFAEYISFGIGTIGVFIIVIGAILASWEYLSHHFLRDGKNKIFSTLSCHLILGLDFLVGKDIIDTLLLNTQNNFWQNLAGLGAIVLIRIILSFFLTRELQQFKQ